MLQYLDQVQRQVPAPEFVQQSAPPRPFHSGGSLPSFLFGHNHIHSVSPAGNGAPTPRTDAETCPCRIPTMAPPSRAAGGGGQKNGCDIPGSEDTGPIWIASAA